MSRAELVACGLAEGLDHYYGNARKEELLADYVSCATMPPWGMMGTESEELAILELDTDIVTAPGTCFCPGWSPLAVFDADEIVTWTDPEHAEALYIGPGYATVTGAEIFIPQRIPVDAVQSIVYYDRASVDANLPLLRAAAAEAGLRLPRTIEVGFRPARFPRDWSSLGPPWTRGEEDDTDDFDF